MGERQGGGDEGGQRAAKQRRAARGWCDRLLLRNTQAPSAIHHPPTFCQLWHRLSHSRWSTLRGLRGGTAAGAAVAGAAAASASAGAPSAAAAAAVPSAGAAAAASSAAPDPLTVGVATTAPTASACFAPAPAAPCLPAALSEETRKVWAVAHSRANTSACCKGGEGAGRRGSSAGRQARPLDCACVRGCMCTPAALHRPRVSKLCTPSDPHTATSTGTPIHHHPALTLQRSTSASTSFMKMPKLVASREVHTRTRKPNSRMTWGGGDGQSSRLDGRRHDAAARLLSSQPPSHFPPTATAATCAAPLCYSQS